MRQQMEDLVKNYHLGMEKGDIDSLLKLYDDKSEIRIVDRNHPPSSPKIVRGKKNIREFYDDILHRDLTHNIESEAIGDNTAAFTDVCLYGDGTRVIGTDMIEMKDGVIAKQITVQAWDE